MHPTPPPASADPERSKDLALVRGDPDGVDRFRGKRSLGTFLFCVAEVLGQAVFQGSDENVLEENLDRAFADASGLLFILHAGSQACRGPYYRLQAFLDLFQLKVLPGERVFLRCEGSDSLAFLTDRDLQFSTCRVNRALVPCSEARFELSVLFCDARVAFSL